MSQPIDLYREHLFEIIIKIINDCLKREMPLDHARKMIVNFRDQFNV